ncbi:unnamed protein product [Gadus morhua 'NCC']
MSRIKQNRWQEVLDAVSAVCGVLRTVYSIKKKWSTIASDAKTRGTPQKRDQAKTGAGMPEVKPITTLEEKILGQVYTQGISTGTEVGLPEEVLENDSVEVSESTAVILTLMDSECDSRTLPTARIIPSPAKKEKHISLQEELLELEKEKMLGMREK